MSKQELNDCMKSFYTSARKQDGSYYKTSSMKSIRAAIDQFLHSPPHCKQFSIIDDPAFTEANQVCDAFVKDLRKTGKRAGVVHKKPITKQKSSVCTNVANSVRPTALIQHNCKERSGSTLYSILDSVDVKTSAR